MGTPLGPGQGDKRQGRSDPGVPTLWVIRSGALRASRLGSPAGRRREIEGTAELTASQDPPINALRKASAALRRELPEACPHDLVLGEPQALTQTPCPERFDELVILDREAELSTDDVGAP